MNVVLWSDGRNDKKSSFPSLPLMKLSAYHKKRGDNVSMYSEDIEDCDILYKSKVFSFTKDLDWKPKAGKVVSGGSGYAISVSEDSIESYCKSDDVALDGEIESQYPDYSIYPQHKREAYGFLTRGCPRNCPFCIVSEKDGKKVVKVADLVDIWRGQKYIKLMDANILASKDREGLLVQLAKSRAFIDYTQGLDVRLIDGDVAKLISNTRVEMIHFAFDSMKDEKQIIKGLQTFKDHTDKHCGALRVYVLVNYDTTREEDVYRLRKIAELGYQPYVMIYQRGTHDEFTTRLRTWANSPYYFSCDFYDYRYTKNGKTCGEIYGDICKIKG